MAGTVGVAPPAAAAELVAEFRRLLAVDQWQTACRLVAAASNALPVKEETMSLLAAVFERLALLEQQQQEKKEEQEEEEEEEEQQQQEKKEQQQQEEEEEEQQQQEEQEEEEQQQQEEEEEQQQQEEEEEEEQQQQEEEEEEEQQEQEQQEEEQQQQEEEEAVCELDSQQLRTQMLSPSDKSGHRDLSNCHAQQQQQQEEEDEDTFDQEALHCNQSVSCGGQWLTELAQSQRQWQRQWLQHVRQCVPVVTVQWRAQSMLRLIECLCSRGHAKEALITVLESLQLYRESGMCFVFALVAMQHLLLLLLPRCRQSSRVSFVSTLHWCLDAVQHRAVPAVSSDSASGELVSPVTVTVSSLTLFVSPFVACLRPTDADGNGGGSDSEWRLQKAGGRCRVLRLLLSVLARLPAFSTCADQSLDSLVGHVTCLAPNYMHLLSPAVSANQPNTASAPVRADSPSPSHSPPPSPSHSPSPSPSHSPPPCEHESGAGLSVASCRLPPLGVAVYVHTLLTERVRSARVPSVYLPQYVFVCALPAVVQMLRYDTCAASATVPVTTATTATTAAPATASDKGVQLCKALLLALPVASSVNDRCLPAVLESGVCSALLALALVCPCQRRRTRCVHTLTALEERFSAGARHRLLRHLLAKNCNYEGGGDASVCAHLVDRVRANVTLAVTLTQSTAPGNNHQPTTTPSTPSAAVAETSTTTTFTSASETSTTITSGATTTVTSSHTTCDVTADNKNDNNSSSSNTNTGDSGRFADDMRCYFIWRQWLLPLVCACVCDSASGDAAPQQLAARHQHLVALLSLLRLLWLWVARSGGGSVATELAAVAARLDSLLTGPLAAAVERARSQLLRHGSELSELTLLQTTAAAAAADADDVAAEVSGVECSQQRQSVRLMLTAIDLLQSLLSRCTECRLEALARPPASYCIPSADCFSCMPHDAL